MCGRGHCTFQLYKLRAAFQEEIVFYMPILIHTRHSDNSLVSLQPKSCLRRPFSFTTFVHQYSYQIEGMNCLAVNQN
jgi:hypothetical protein